MRRSVKRSAASERAPSISIPVFHRIIPVDYIASVLYPTKISIFRVTTSLNQNTVTSIMPLLDSFDPFATHPFTNNSGLAPRPPQPSQYPASPPQKHNFPSPQSAPSSSPPATQNHSPVKAPQPRIPPPGSPNTSNSPRPIFVPFKQERSSPDLGDIVKKKSQPKTNDASQKRKS